MLKENKISFKKINFYLLYLIIAVIPFINYAYQYEFSKNLYSFFGKSKIDFYTFYKGKWFVLLTILLFIIFAIGLGKKEYRIKKNKKLYILLSSFFVLMFLSTIFSDYQNIAWSGLYNQNEGFWVAASYLAVFFITYNLIETERELKNILYVLLGTNIVLGIIGLFDYFGYVFTEIEFLHNLMLPEYLHGKIDFVQRFKNEYIALFWGNPNYVGSYGSIMFVLSFVLFYFKKLNEKFLYISTVCAFILLIGSVSRAGMLGAIVSLFFFFVFHIKDMFVEKDKLQRVFILTLILILVFLGMNYHGNNKIGSDINSLSQEFQTGINKGETKYWIDDLEIKNQKIYINTDYNELKIDWKNKTPEFVVNQQKNNYQIEKDKIKFDKKIKRNEFKYKDNVLYWFNDNLKVRIKFIKYQDKILMSGNHNSFSIIEKPETLFFEGKEMLASKRGYIWSRSIPLLKRSFIFGSGPDTFVFQFPQNDFLGKLQTMNRTNHIFQKPHNMYLAFGIEYGAISLLVFLTILILYYKTTVINKITNNHSNINIAISLSLLAYLVAGIFNDTVIINSIIFWLLLALGYTKLNK